MADPRAPARLALIAALLVTTLFGLGAASAAPTSGPDFVPPAHVAPPTQGGELYSNVAPMVAIFRDDSSWGAYLIEDILTANGIPYDAYTSADMGVVSLGAYTKVFIPALQTPAYYAAFMSNAASFQAYVQAGGVLQIHAAAWEVGYDRDWGGYPAAIYPGMTYTHYYGSEAHFAIPGHPILLMPHALTESQVGCCYPHHGALSAPGAVVIQTGDGGDPIMAELGDGAGVVLASTLTSDFPWGGGVEQAEENYVLYLIGGVSPPVPELSSILLAGAGAGLVGIVLAMRRK